MLGSSLNAPPGCGKSLLARAIAGACGLPKECRSCPQGTGAIPRRGRSWPPILLARRAKCRDERTPAIAVLPGRELRLGRPGTHPRTTPTCSFPASTCSGAIVGKESAKHCWLARWNPRARTAPRPSRDALARKGPSWVRDRWWEWRPPSKRAASRLPDAHQQRESLCAGRLISESTPGLAERALTRAVIRTGKGYGAGTGMKHEFH
jgi:hypothetical protein